MISKMVTDRLKASESVLAALRHLGPVIGAQTAALFSPYLQKGEELPDFELVAQLVERLLADLAETMAKADATHNEELADDAEPRARRDEAARETYSALVDVKTAITPMFGAAWVEKLKIPAVIPQDPATLARVAPEVKEAIENASLPKPQLRGVKSFDKQPWIEEIRGPAQDLAKALKDVTREAREAEATLIKKTRAIASYDEGFTKSVALTQALLRIIGESEHANRLRPSLRRPGTLASEESVPAPEAPAGEPKGS